MFRERKLQRLKDFDYSSENYYFITACTKNRINYLGQVINGEMVLNRYGKIVQRQWLWMKDQFKYVCLDEYVVMPNHFHGIIHISPVGNGRDRSLQGGINKIKPLSELIGAFKTTSSKLIHRSGLVEFKWQKSFHDVIVRNERILYNIRNYIKNNPLNWVQDRMFSNKTPDSPA